MSEVTIAEGSKFIKTMRIIPKLWKIISVNKEECLANITKLYVMQEDNKIERKWDWDLQENFKIIA